MIHHTRLHSANRFNEAAAYHCGKLTYTITGDDGRPMLQ